MKNYKDNKKLEEIPEVEDSFVSSNNQTGIESNENSLNNLKKSDFLNYSKFSRKGSKK